jgi:hypothetical protein
VTNVPQLGRVSISPSALSSASDFRTVVFAFRVTGVPVADDDYQVWVGTPYWGTTWVTPGQLGDLQLSKIE